jgi:hypothetical protein
LLTCEHPFVTSQGTPHGRLQRALEGGNLLQALAAAHELGDLAPGDGLALCRLLADEQSPRFPRAAVRWAARLMLKVPTLELDEATLLLPALRALTGPDSDEAAALLVRLLQRYHVLVSERTVLRGHAPSGV